MVFCYWIEIPRLWCVDVTFLRGVDLSLNAIVKCHDKVHCVLCFVLEYNNFSGTYKGA